MLPDPHGGKVQPAQTAQAALGKELARTPARLFLHAHVDDRGAVGQGVGPHLELFLVGKDLLLHHGQGPLIDGKIQMKTSFLIRGPFGSSISSIILLSR